MAVGIRVRWFVAAIAVVLVCAATALAASSKVKVHAPKSVKIGTTYSVTTTGRASGKANFLVGFENGPCKKTYAAEYNTYGTAAVPLSTPVKGKFSKKLMFSAGSAGRHYFCAYLINRKTTKTYAHAHAHWTEQ